MILTVTRLPKAGGLRERAHEIIVDLRRRRQRNWCYVVWR